MKRLVIAAVLVGIVALVAGYARAQDPPWKPAEPKVPPAQNLQPAPPAGAPGEAPPAGAPAADKPAVDLEKALTPELYQRVIKPILYQIEQADRVLGLYEKEMAKPEKERNENRATEYRENAARFYLTASQKAQQAKKTIPEVENQNAITNQYELPMRDKALAIYADLAAERMEKKDVAAAVKYYQQILKIDPENAVAKEELKRIEAALKAQRDAKKPADARSGHDKDKEQQPISHPTQNYIPDYTDKHAPADYQDRGTRQDKYR
jgi:tetratricopeptide (TPR) repeat protein